MDNKRYITVMESIAGSCKEVKDIRSGHAPKPSWSDFSKEMKAMISKEKVIA